jgi:electron transport complex protein RnfE
MVLPSGGFFTLAGWLLLFNWRKQRKAKREERTSLALQKEAV